MSILNVLRPESNNKLKINFDGGNLSSDAGLLLLKEFICKVDLNELILQHFQTNNQTIRFHKDSDNLLQKIYQQIAGYFSDDITLNFRKYTADSKARMTNKMYLNSSKCFFVDRQGLYTHF